MRAAWFLESQQTVLEKICLMYEQQRKGDWKLEWLEAMCHQEVFEKGAPDQGEAKYHRLCPNEEICAALLLG